MDTDNVPLHPSTSRVPEHNNNNTIWGGSVLTGEEPPPHAGELNHALSQVGGPTQSQLSRPTSSRHRISMEHRLRRRHLLLNPNTNAGSGRQGGRVALVPVRLSKLGSRFGSLFGRRGIEISSRDLNFDPLSWLEPPFGRSKNIKV